MDKIQSELESSVQTICDISGGTPIKREDSTWSPLKAGLFGGDVGRFREVKGEFDSHVERVTRGWI
jgi:hypothetical protein